MSDERDENVVELPQVPTGASRRIPRGLPGGAFATRSRPDVLVVIALGGGLGTLGRYGIAQHVHVAAGTFPWPTFVTNLSGAFALGLFLTIALERFPPTRYVRPFFAIGFLGAFTTFSTMAVETVTLAKDGYAVLGVSYLLLSIGAGLIVTYLGISIARLLPFGRTSRI